MQVVHVVPSLDPASGGPARSVPALCAAEAAAGADVSLVTFGPSSRDRRSTYRTISVAPLPGTRQGLTPAFGRAIGAAVEAADVVHLHSLWNPPVAFAAWSARRAGVPYVVSPRGMLQGVSLQRKRTLKRVASVLGERRTIERASGLHFLTDEELHTSVGVPDVPVLVAPNGVAEPSGIDRGSFKRRFPQIGDRRVLLFLGRLHWSKGLDLQRLALRKLLAGRQDVIWVLVGPDEGEWRELERQIESDGSAGHVLWTGPLEHSASLEALVDADVVLITSHHEAHSMSMNEALILGKPLILTDTVGFPAAAERGAALQVRPDAGELTETIESILDDSGLAEALGDAGRAFARAELSWPSIADRMLAFYGRVLATAR